MMVNRRASDNGLPRDVPFERRSSLLSKTPQQIAAIKIQIAERKIMLVTGEMTLDKFIERASLETTLSKALAWLVMADTDVALHIPLINRDLHLEEMFSALLQVYPHKLLKEIR